jgi:hypothetical protein
MVRPATADDFRGFFGRDPPAVWLGLAAEEDGPGDKRTVVGMGVVHWDELGRAWGSYSATRQLSAATMHRAAQRTLAALSGAGEPALYVYCNMSIRGAEKWLRRLGFTAAPEMTSDARYPVWKWPISA